MPDFDIKALCDICQRGFAVEDLADPHGVVRLNPVSGTEHERDGQTGRSWEIVGFGSGYGTIFVHRDCLTGKGQKWPEGEEDFTGGPGEGDSIGGYR